MSINQSRREAEPFVRRVIANDYTCDPDDFLKDGLTINEFVPRLGGRGYQPPPYPFQACTFGHGIVITGHAEFIEPVRAIATGLERDKFFWSNGIAPLVPLVEPRGLTLQGPSMKHALTADRFTPARGYLERTELLETEAVLALENTPGFPIALTFPPYRHENAHLAGVSYDGERLIAVAEATEEAPGFWQIAVDVLAEARGTGLGHAIVSRVSAAILERGGLPYYSVAPSNIASRSIAHRLGFWPVFTEMYTLPADMP